MVLCWDEFAAVLASFVLAKHTTATSKNLLPIMRNFQLIQLYVLLKGCITELPCIISDSHFESELSYIDDHAILIGFYRQQVA